MAPRAAPSGIGWLTALAIVAVVAVNAAGIWGIAVARRGALDEERRAFRSRVEARGRAIESRLTSARADLAFLGGSPAISAIGRTAGREEAWLGAARSAVLLFLRGHEEVVRVVVLSEQGEPLLHAGRRGGIPLLWASTRPTGREGAAVSPETPRLVTRLSREGGLTLEMEVGAAQLLQQDEAAARCELRGGDGLLLAGEALAPERGVVEAAAAVEDDGWSIPRPWTLRCVEAEAAAAVGLAEPVASRYRTTLLLNLGVMALALFLGAFAVQQARRRERLEAAAREEARVRELERQLLHAERLTTVGRLAAGIAHEINNPLEGMANWLSLADRALEGGSASEARQHVGRVREGLERIAGTVRQVLAHADPAHAPRTELDLNDVLRETGEFVRSRKEFDRIAFRIELEPHRLAVRGNATMLGQVAVNLILNACEAQPEGGEVLVRSRREGAAIVGEVADRGPGVPEDDRRRIFEPFFSTKESTGLGLSICHTIVRQHEGELVVTAREGGGAVVQMRLPAAEGGES
jgi:signal transduction histidine kinase